MELLVTKAGVTTPYAYQCDRAGSVIGLTDASGTLVASYRYDPWGSVTSVGGSDLALANRNPLRYRGYYYDAATALYYLPARYYDPGTARFLSPDPAAPSAGDPLSLNRYGYCACDPVNASDPSGAVVDVDGDGKVGSTDTAEAMRSTRIVSFRRLIAKYQAQATHFAQDAVWYGALAQGFENAYAVWYVGAGIICATVSLGLGGVVLWGGNQAGAALDGDELAAVESVVAEAPVHGNSAASPRTAYLYRLYSQDGTYLKTGISQNPAARYTQGYMVDKDLYVITQGSRSGMLALERNIVSVDPGPLNLEPWAVAARGGIR